MHLRQLLITLGLLGTLAAPAAADTTLTTSSRETGISAGSGVLLYSAYDADSRQYHLMQRAQGALGPVPITSSPKPFEADVGPTAGGHAYYVYSRCSGRANSCDLYVFNPATGVEQRSKASDPHHDDLMPTYWRGRLAFMREYGTPGHPHQVVYQRPNGHTSRSVRVPGIPRHRCDRGKCLNTRGLFEGLELHDDQLAQIVESNDANTAAPGDRPLKAYPEPVTELRLVDRGLTRSRRLLGAPQSEDAELFTGVAIDGDQVLASFGCSGPCDRHKPGIYRYDTATGAFSFARDALVGFRLAADAGAVFEERDNDAATPEGLFCRQPEDDGDASGAPRCVIERLSTPAFRAIPTPH